MFPIIFLLFPQICHIFPQIFVENSGKLRASRSSKRASGRMPGPGGPKVAVRHGQRVAFAAEGFVFFFGREMWRKTYFVA